MAGKKGQQTTDAVEILRHRFVEGDAKSEVLLEELAPRPRSPAPFTGYEAGRN